MESGVLAPCVQGEGCMMCRTCVCRYGNAQELDAAESHAYGLMRGSIKALVSFLFCASLLPPQIPLLAVVDMAA